MQSLGFVSAILPELSLQDVVAFAATENFQCVELMCWPRGKAERRYAGVTHVDVNGLDSAAARQINDLFGSSNLSISGLGYYPNPLVADASEAKVYTDHIRRVIEAAAKLGLDVVNTFVGRDPLKTIDENWPRFLETWQPLIAFAAEHKVRIGIENCPMSFSRDEWPGGKNLAISPAVWRRMFSEVPSDYFGLNFDPSHFVWQLMDYCQAIRDFAPKLFHVHAKDATLDRHRLNQVGLLAYPLEFHTPRLPGLGDVDWSAFFAALHEARYDGPVCIEVEDRAYEGSLDTRKAALRQSGRYLRQFMP